MENYVKEELNYKYYKGKMNIDIENINTIEKRHKVYTKLWSTIYKFEKKCLKETDIFLDDFMKTCNNNANKAQFFTT